MYVFRAVSLAPQIELLSLLSADAVFCSVLEANVNDPGQYAGGLLKRLFLEAQKQIEPTGEPFTPEELARTIDGVLKNWKIDEGRYQVVFYAGVLVQRGRVAVCTAGDIRVQLVKGGQLAASTRDHNMVDDAPADPDETLKNLPREFLLSVPTRCLDGTSNHGLPESVTWPIASGDRVVLCSSEFHKYANPRSYFPLSLDVFSLPGDRQDEATPGAIVEIEWQ